MEFNIKQKNNLFLKSLIESDFLFLDQKNKKSLRSIKKVSKGQVSSSLTFLDPLETVKTLKQSIRLLQFLKKQKSGFLHVVVENKQHLDLANAFFKSYPLCLPHLVVENIPTKSINSSVSQLLLLLNFPLNNKETFFKRIFDKNIFLVNKINAKIEKNNWSTYKVYNELTDFKKIIFLLIITHKVLNNQK